MCNMGPGRFANSLPLRWADESWTRRAVTPPFYFFVPNQVQSLYPQTTLRPRTSETGSGFAVKVRGDLVERVWFIFSNITMNSAGGMGSRVQQCLGDVLSFLVSNPALLSFYCILILFSGVSNISAPNN